MMGKHRSARPCAKRLMHRIKGRGRHSGACRFRTNGCMDPARGGITLFLCVILSIVVPLVLILTDVARVGIARLHVREAVRLAAESLLTGYDRPLKDQYGLLALSPRTGGELVAEAGHLLGQNLEHPAGIGVGDALGMKVVASRVWTGKPLDTPEPVLTSFSALMRYRAPVQLSAGFLEKLKALSGAVRQTRTIDAEMELDRMRAATREDQVRLYLLMIRRLDKFGGSRGVIRSGRELATDLSALAETVRGSVTGYEAQASSLQGLLAEYQDRHRQVLGAQDEAVLSENRLRQAREALRIAEASLQAAQKKDMPEAQARCLAAIVDVGACEAEMQRCTRVLSAMREALSAWREAKWQPVEEAAARHLSELGEGVARILSHRSRMAEGLCRYVLYLDKAIFLSNRLLGQLAGLDGKLRESAALTQQPSAAGQTGSLQAAVAKNPVFPDAQTMKAARDTFQTMREVVLAWQKEEEEAVRGASRLLTQIERVASAFAALQGDALSLFSVPGLPEGCHAMAIAGTETGTLMDRQQRWEQHACLLRASPACLPGQLPSEKEAADYQEWFVGWSGEANEEALPAGGEDREGTSAGTLRSLRQAAAATAANVREGKGAKSGGEMTAAMLEALPSRQSSVPAEDMMALHPYAPRGDEPAGMHEARPNALTAGVASVAKTASSLSQLTGQATDALLRQLWADAYILCAFTNATTDGKGIPDEIFSGRKLENNVFQKGEVEYILFGQPSEQANLMAMKGALFALRLAMNLVHVHASPQKRAATLALATTLAGWTAFGIPVVQNFLLLGWAAAEACSDVDRLLKGEAVPLVKTDANWFLSVGSFRDELVQKLLLDPLKGRVSGAAGRLVGKADDAVRDTVGGWMDAAIDSVFAPLEIACEDYGDGLAEVMDTRTQELPERLAGEVSRFVGTLPAGLPQELMRDGFARHVEQWIETLRTTCMEIVSNRCASEVTALREQLKRQLKTQVFASPFYRSLCEHARTTAMGLTDEVFSSLSDKADAIMGPGAGPSGLAEGIAGRMATMTYSEYLAVFLLMMPQSVKTLRAADLIQVNMQRALRDDTYLLGERQLTVVVEAEVEMRLWFIPGEWVRKSGMNRIQARSEMGYWHASP